MMGVKHDDVHDTIEHSDASYLLVLCAKLRRIAKAEDFGTLRDAADMLEEISLRIGTATYERYPNGAPKWAPDGTLLAPEGGRSIFDDVDE